MNPMIAKELRHHIRQGRGWWFLTLYLLLLGGIAVFAYQGQPGVGDRTGIQATDGAELGIALFRVVTLVQLGLLLLLVPVFSAGGLTAEKEQRTLAGLLTSQLTPREIWWGKYAASVLVMALLLVAAIPVSSLSFALGGVDAREILGATGLSLAMVASLCAVSLYCSSRFRRSVHSTAASYVLLLTFSVLTLLLHGLLESRFGNHPDWEDGIRAYAKTPMYLNPFYATLSLTQPVELKRFGGSTETDWKVSLAAFAALGGLASIASVRNVSRSGEHT